MVGDGRGDGSAAWRLVAQRYRSDGFRRNVYLQRTDTNGYDETTCAASSPGSSAPQLQTQLTLLYADLDNGYDAWSVDNTRITHSNQPGRDAQRSTGAALRAQYTAAGGTWLSISSAASVGHRVFLRR